MIYEIAPESVNYDYLHGEPESHRALFITLRDSPANEHIQIGSIVKYNQNNDPGNILANVHYKVIDIHGRSLVVEPVNALGRQTCTPIINIKNNYYKSRFLPGIVDNAGFYDVNHNSPISTPSNSYEKFNYYCPDKGYDDNFAYPRTGKYTYMPRPTPQYGNLADVSYQIPRYSCQPWTI